LVEYAHQIKPIVDKSNLEKYYANTIGVEKEDRLAKIAKRFIFYVWSRWYKDI